MSLIWGDKPTYHTPYWLWLLTWAALIGLLLWALL